MKHEDGLPAGVMARRRRLHRQLMLFWLCLTLLGFGAVLLALFAAGMFSGTDQRIRQTMEVQLNSTGTSLANYMEKLTAKSLALADEAGQEIDGMLLRSGLTFDALNNAPALLGELQKTLYPALDLTLQATGSSGAYLVLDATANTEVPGAEHSRSGMYLRCVNLSGTSLAQPDVAYFRGVADVARQKQMELHNRWQLEFDVSALPGYTALMQKEITRPADACFWTEKLPLRDTWEEAMLLCVPILGGGKTVYGACGVEVSQLFFQLALPAKETEFGPLVTVLAPVEDGRLMLHKGLAGAAPAVFEAEPESLTIHQGKAFNTYLGEDTRYVGLQKPVALSQDDTEYRQWVVALLLPGEAYDAYAAASRRQMVCAGLAVLAVLTGLSLLLYRQLVRHLGSPRPEALDQGLQAREDLNVLLDYVRRSAPGQLAEGTKLPRCIEQAMSRFAQRARALSVEERRLLHLLAQGVPPAQLPGRVGQSARLLRWRLARLCDSLGVDSEDELLLYLDFFRRCGRLAQLGLEGPAVL